MKKPKILFYDIETRPNLGYVWGKWETNALAFKEEWQLLSFAYKWQGDRSVKCFTNRTANDKPLLIRLRDLFQKADIIVAHNGDEFDFKKATARMVYHGIPPVKQVASVDTKKVAKKFFEFNGNGLSDLSKYFKLGSKTPNTGFDLWLGCIANKPSSWRTMVKYNKQDVVLLEKLYNKMLPWITNHPNIAKIIDPNNTSKSSCPQCNSTNTVKRGFKATRASVQQQRVCFSCGHWFLTSIERRVIK